MWVTGSREQLKCSGNVLTCLYTQAGADESATGPRAVPWDPSFDTAHAWGLGKRGARGSCPLALP